MDSNADFTTVLRTFMRQARRTPMDLAHLAGIALNTVRNWTSGKVQRPRVVSDVLAVARALALDATDANALLTAAGHPLLATLHAQAEQSGDSALRTLLATWPLPAARDQASSVAAPAHAPRYHLRAPVADFVGRAREIEQLASALRRALNEQCGAIISGVQGMGGIGKTELAYALAHQLRDAFPDAQLVLNLQGSGTTPLTPEQTLQTVIHILSPEVALPAELSSLKQHYRTCLHNSRMLILADDARDAAQVQGLIPPAGSAVLITSRQRFSLPGMATLQLEQLDEEEAVSLLRTICPRLNDPEAALLARACGYLPLALRISGSILHSTPALAVTNYLAQLNDERQRLRALRDPDAPQLDVEASLAFSYAQLDQAAQQVFRQLGVFVADFATTLAQAVVETPEGVEVEVMLHSLLRRNMLLYDAEQARWRLHDLLRDLARRYLEASGETRTAWWRYARAAVQIAHSTQEQYLAGGDRMLAAQARFDAERAHIDAARRWAAEQAGTEEGDRLLVDDAAATLYIGALRYNARGERIPHWKRVVEAARRLGDQRAEGRTLGNLGGAYIELGEARRAIDYCEQALRSFRALGDRYREGVILGNLGLAFADLGETRRAIAFYEQNLAILHEIGDQSYVGNVLGNLGDAYMDLGEAQRAIDYYEQALRSFRALGDRYREGIVLGSLGRVYTELGTLQRAIEYCEVACTIAREMGDQRTEGYALSNLGRAQARRGDLGCATTTFEQAIALFYAVGDRLGAAKCNWQVGLAFVQQGERERALPLLRAALAYEQEIGHARAAEHAALLARLAVGEKLAVESLH